MKELETTNHGSWPPNFGMELTVKVYDLNEGETVRFAKGHKKYTVSQVTRFSVILRCQETNADGSHNVAVVDLKSTHFDFIKC